MAALELVETIPESALQDARLYREWVNANTLLGRAQSLDGQSQMARVSLAEAR